MFIHFATNRYHATSPNGVRSTRSWNRTPVAEFINKLNAQSNGHRYRRVLVIFGYEF